MDAKKEQFLLYRIRVHHDGRAFDLIYQEYAESITRFLAAKLPRKEIDDARSTTFLRLWPYLQEVEVENIGGLIYTIARRVIAEFYNERERKPLVEIEHEILQETIDDPAGLLKLETDAEISLVKQALDALSDDHQMVIMLKHIHGLSASEIGKRMNRSEAAVRVLLHRATVALRTQFNPHERKGIDNAVEEPEGLA